MSEMGDDDTDRNPVSLAGIANRISAGTVRRPAEARSVQMESGPGSRIGSGGKSRNDDVFVTTATGPSDAERCATGYRRDAVKVSGQRRRHCHASGKEPTLDPPDQ